MTAPETAKILAEIFSDLDNVEIEALYQNEDGWPIPSWDVEDRAEEIAFSTVDVSISETARESLRRWELASIVEAQAGKMIASAKAAGIELVMQPGDINIRSGVKIVLTATTSL